ncbi:hypothetical protein N7495_003435 [Penicillium taxi]|uniref:uncharacterized protein n=1 Tax=Penicillium taxi TaxID=168475 RepID=UPI002544E828|nr:uncharacterized protein N7495_003435 [Penicillium taxi]KAJ5902907.1 hypothetical protein N7495_003435 [Penicillium taxi]
MSPLDPSSIPTSADSMSPSIVLPSKGYREPDLIESETSGEDGHGGNREAPQSTVAKSALWQGTPLPPGWIWSPLGTIVKFPPEDPVVTQPIRPAPIHLFSAPMPDPGSPGAPCFDGKDVTDQSHETDEEIRHFLTEFSLISDVLMSRGLMPELMRCEWLLQGLPTWLSSEVIERREIYFDDPSSVRKIHLSWLLQVAMDTLNAQRHNDLTMKIIEQQGPKKVGFSAEKPLILTKAWEASGMHERDVSNERLTNQIADMIKGFDQLKLAVNNLSLTINAQRNPAHVPSEGHGPSQLRLHSMYSK